MAFKLDKNKFNFGKGTGSSPHKLVTGLVGTAIKAGKAYVYGKQAAKEMGVIKKDKTDLPGSDLASVAGSKTGLINEARHQYKKYKDKKTNKKTAQLKAKFKSKYKSLADKYGHDKAKQIMKKSLSDAKRKHKL
jgi:hypothetical protein